MRELIMHCPRCGGATTASQSACPACGLEVQFQRHANRSERGFAELSHGASLHGMHDPYAPDHYAPSPAMPFPSSGGGSTGRYDISSEFENDAADVGEVDVGGMQDVLMDVSDVGSLQEEQESAGTPKSGGGELQLGKHAYVDERVLAEEEEKAAAKKKPSGTDELSELESLAPSEVKVAVHRATAEEARKALVNRYLIKRLLPQVVALFLVLILGSVFVKGPAKLDGEYLVTFRGQAGREDVAFRTTFRYDANSQDQVHGNLKLYTATRNIPEILDTVYQDGYILYEGSTADNELTLLLGSTLADRGAMLDLTVTFNSSFTEGEGKLADAQGATVAVQVEKYQE